MQSRMPPALVRTVFAYTPGTLYHRLCSGCSASKQQGNSAYLSLIFWLALAYLPLGSRRQKDPPAKASHDPFSKKQSLMQVYVLHTQGASLVLGRTTLKTPPLAMQASPFHTPS